MEHNFFDDVKVQKPKTNYLKLGFILVIIGVFAYLIIGAGMNFVRYMGLNAEILILQQETTDTAEAARRLLEAQNELSMQQFQLSALAVGDVFVRNNQVVTSYLIEHIVEITPQYTLFDTLSVTGRELRMEGFVERFQVLAQFQQSFSNSRGFTDAFVRHAQQVEVDPDAEVVVGSLSNGSYEGGNTMEGAFEFSATANVASDIAAFEEILVILRDAAGTTTNRAAWANTLEVFDQDWLSDAQRAGILNLWNEITTEPAIPEPTTTSPTTTTTNPATTNQTGN